MREMYEYWDGSRKLRLARDTGSPCDVMNQSLRARGSMLNLPVMYFSLRIVFSQERDSCHPSTEQTEERHHEAAVY